MKKIILFFSLIPLFSIAQVGIGTTDPRTTLDVNGAITNREVSFAVASNAVTIATETSLANITGSATATIAVTSFTPTVNGCRLIISNNTTGGFGATFAGMTIPNSQAIEFVYTNGVWKTTAGGTGAANNIYNSNGTLSGNRTVTQGASSLTFTGTGNTILNSGNVGVGTTTPLGKLNVSGGLVVGSGTNSANTTGIPFTYGNTTNSAIWFGNYDNTASSDYATMYFQPVSADVSTLNIVTGDNASGGVGSDDSVFIGNVEFSSGTKKGMTIKNGFAGIGNTTPNAPLQFASATANRKIVMYEDGNNDHQFYGFGVNSSTLRYQVSGVLANHIFYAGNSASASTELMRIQGDGKVAIGTAFPSAQLHTTGTVRFAGAGTPSDGRSLVTDATGLATWQNPLASNSTSTAIAASATQVAVPSTNVQGAISDLATAIKTNSSANDWKLDGNSNGAIKKFGTIDAFDIPFITSNTEKMRILTNGNIGVATATPTLSLDVTSTTGIGTKASNATPWDHTYLFSDTTASYFTAGGADNGLRFRVGNGASGTYGGQTYTTAMTMLPSGNVGIGTTNPTAQLHTTGSVLFAGAGTPALNRVLVSDATGLATWQKQTATNTDSNAIVASATQVAVPSTNVQGAISDLATAIKTNSSANDWKLDGNSNGTIKNFGTIDAFDLPFITNNVERMRIKSGGNIGIGTTNPLGKLNVSGGFVVGTGTNGANTTGIPFSFGDATNSAIWFGNYDNTASSDYGVMYLQPTAGDTATLNIIAGDNASGGASDESVFIGNMDFSGTKKGVTVKNGFTGIGTTAPTAQLHTTGSVLFAGAGTPALNRVLVSDATGLATWQKQTATNTDSNAIAASTTQVAVPSTNVQGAISDLATVIKTVSANDWKLDGNSNGVIKKFGTIDGFDVPFITSNVERMRILSNGNVGVGSTNPTKKFTVENGSIRPAIGNSQDAGISFPTDIGGGGGDEAFVRYYVESGENTKLSIGINNDADDDISFFQAGAERMNIYNGNVGIGTTIPIAQFHTTGSVLFAGAGTPVLGRSLVTDATGLATWQNPLASNSTSTAITANTTQVAVPSTNVQGAISDLATAIKTVSTNDWKLDGNSNGVIKKFGTIDGFDVPFITSNTERMRILSSGNIGIGTTTAPHKLTISGNLSLGVDNGSTFQSKNASGTYENFLWPRWSDNIMYLNYGASGFNIRNNSSVSTMFMTNAGNIGIGTTTPNASLQFANSIANRKVVLWEAANNDHQYYGFGINNNVLRYQVNTASDSHVFYAGSSATTSNELMRVQGNGNVGIGSTNPTKKLTVENGSIRPAVGNSQDAGVYFPTDIGGGGGDEAFIRYYVESGENTKLMIGVNNDADDDISFYQGGAERMNIYNGNVGIGTTTPVAKLDLTGLKATGSGTGTGGSNDNPSQAIIPAGNNGASRLNDWPAGWGGGLSTFDIVGASTFMNGYLTRSDFRLKNDIKSVDNSIFSNFMKIRPVTYFMKEQTKETEGLQYGFIAQEIRDLFPSMVTKSDDPNGIIGMNYQALISPTIYVVQQQQAKIDELQKQVDSQNEKLSKMEEELQQIKQLLSK